MLKGKTIILGVTGSIAAYKMANLASMLVKLHCNVHVIMTKNATNFIHPITFETLTNHKCLIDTFDRDFQYNVEHVNLAKQADLLLVAPATANIIAKLCYGLADDMLSTTALACHCKKLIAPAMNTNMYHNPIVQDNLEKLKTYGYEIIQPSVGMLACKDIGEGKLESEEVILEYILRELAYEKTMQGKKVLITAGATMEAIDPVRFISNHSTGKMGYALAKVCMEKGANVTLISGNARVKPPKFLTFVAVKSAYDMFQEVKKIAMDQDIIIMAAAVADYTPKTVHSEKVKKSENLAIELDKTTDILQYLGEVRQKNQFLCGFSMETQNMLENSRAKLEKKKVDMIVANNLKEKGAGFGTDTNIVTLITKDSVEELDIMLKEEVANAITNKIMERIEKSNS